NLSTILLKRITNSAMDYNMLTPSVENMPKRKAINLTIREDILKEAKDLGLNASKAAELGILAAIKQTREQCWLGRVDTIQDLRFLLFFRDEKHHTRAV
ncbi:MAG: type II toxin-antitoxin system CcdA family antitoxin, partial [Alphaproteobacteria bacterium]